MHPSEYRYLVIEDDKVANDFLVYMLRKMGATSIEVAANGEEGLAYLTLTEKIPDIVICDLRMPQIDGVAFLRHLAEKKFNGGVILVSESSNRILRMATYLAEAHHLNVLGVMSKPFHLLRSSASLDNLLKRLRGRDKTLSYLPSSAATPSALREAIRHGHIAPYFQPKIDVKTNKTIGVEALARWVQPDNSIVPPGLFIPVAEKHGLINELTESILSQTLSQASQWHADGLKFSVAINFSALSLSDVNLPDHLDTELRKANLIRPI